MVGAGQCMRIYKQMREYPIDIIGNYGLQYARYDEKLGAPVVERDLVLPCDRKSVSERVEMLRKKYGFTEFAGESVEFHPSGCVTFPILGTKAKQEDKLAFDPDRKKRRAIYDDINHDGTIDELDIVYLGSSLPKVTGGWGFKLRWGRLSWNNQFNFRYGNKIINRVRMNAENMYSNNNQSRAVNWRWRVEGDDARIPRALRQHGYNWLGSDRFVEDGSFMRLNYSQISYSCPANELKRFGLNRLDFYVSANNLFCLTNYSGSDPEVGYGGLGIVTDNAQTPRAKSFTAGVTIGF